MELLATRQLQPFSRTTVDAGTRAAASGWSLSGTKTYPEPRPTLPPNLAAGGTLMAHAASRPDPPPSRWLAVSYLWFGYQDSCLTACPISLRMPTVCRSKVWLHDSCSLCAAPVTHNCSAHPRPIACMIMVIEALCHRQSSAAHQIALLAGGCWHSFCSRL